MLRGWADEPPIAELNKHKSLFNLAKLTLAKKNISKTKSKLNTQNLILGLAW